ncbi:unnamed protein product [Gongylonema pulchrum]|uniref:Uncharacterized protein n=1 Tax=Gongylonema pulchrum TaxID=637853 RepID=A0A3P6SPQ6_9BILA|nr:unnamed protein product [Gongylonema pulchrum]
MGSENPRALYLCATLAAKDESTVKDAEKLLEKTTVNSRLHHLLGDFLTKMNRPIDACHQYRLESLVTWKLLFELYRLYR